MVSDKLQFVAFLVMNSSPQFRAFSCNSESSGNHRLKSVLLSILVPFLLSFLFQFLSGRSRRGQC